MILVLFFDFLASGWIILVVMWLGSWIPDFHSYSKTELRCVVDETHWILRVIMLAHLNVFIFTHIFCLHLELTVENTFLRCKYQADKVYPFQ